jgi:hypothetical protein
VTGDPTDIARDALAILHFRELVGVALAARTYRDQEVGSIRREAAYIILCEQLAAWEAIEAGETDANNR